MSDVTPQLVSGAAILLSFFAGYKYALRVMRATDASTESAHRQLSPEAGPSTVASAGAAAAEALVGVCCFTL